jgi:hypothetical protein
MIEKLTTIGLIAATATTDISTLLIPKKHRGK